MWNEHVTRLWLSLALAAVLALGLVASLMVYDASQRVAETTELLVDRAISDLDSVARLRAEIAEHERLAYELYAAIDADTFRPRLLEQRATVKAHLPELLELGLSKSEMGSVEERWAGIVTDVDELIDNIAADNTDWDGARAQLKRIRDRRRTINPILDDLTSQLQARVEMAQQRNRSELGFMSSLVFAYTVAIVLVALGVGWLLHRLFKTNERNHALAQFPARNPLPVLTVDAAGEIGYANESAHRFVNDVLGADAAVRALLPDRIARQFSRSGSDRRQGVIEGQVGDQTLTYHWHWLEDRRLFHVYVRDVTAERAAEARLRQMAYEDDITGLFNRQAMLEYLENLLRRRRGAGLAVLSMERFHLLASTLGFSGSDAVLERFGKTLSSVVEASLGQSAAVARMEAGAFAIGWLPAGDEPVADELTGLLDRLPAVVQTPRRLFHTAYNIGACLVDGDDNRSTEDMLSDASAALQAVERRADTRCLIHNATIRDKEQQVLRIEEKLREAIDTGERGLTIHLQPQVAMAAEGDTSPIVGAEALIRWTDPELGEMSPGQFIPIAEQSGLIVELGRWVIKRALDMLADWRDDPQLCHIRLAINAAAVELYGQDYADQVIDGLDRRGVAPDRLEVEITERVLADSAAMSRADNLKKLCHAGVRLAIDDFGTGYSSLAYLATMPINQIKIDKQFVDPLPPEKDARVLAPVMVNLAGELQLECLAEGVETAEQAAYLRRIGCPYAQGFYYAKPGPREEFERLVRSD